LQDSGNYPDFPFSDKSIMYLYYQLLESIILNCQLVIMIYHQPKTNYYNLLTSSGGYIIQSIVTGRHKYVLYDRFIFTYTIHI